LNPHASANDQQHLNETIVQEPVSKMNLKTIQKLAERDGWEVETVLF